MQQLKSIQKDGDYLGPATILAEAYVVSQQLAFDFASNKSVFLKHYANKIWFEHKSSYPHFAEMLEAYYQRQF